MPYRRTPAIQARLDAQRRAVLVAAIAALAKHGNAGCSMAAVAVQAGISTGSLYAHFANKAELVVELFRTAAAPVEAFRAFDADPDAAVAVLHGAHGVFGAGADLTALGTPLANRAEPVGDGLMGSTRLHLSKPVIVAVSGHAVAGGLELACWCDLRAA